MVTFIDILFSLLPVIIFLSISVGLIVSLKIMLERRWLSTFRLQLILLALTVLATLGVILTLPLSETLRGQLLSLMGILLSAAIALSSTTFIGNMLAGIMLRLIKSAYIGDFITVNEITGRISEMGLLHTEVQTEDRDLVTLPNLFLVTQPMKVVRSSGTIVSAEVSLGYDVSRHLISERLQIAAEKAGLINSFVQVRELGDYSVLYRIAGLKEEVKGLISARSKLREEVLDSLHESGIEIVSPNFMNTRVLPEAKVIIPKVANAKQEADVVQQEDIAFDKADEAASIEGLRLAFADLKQKLEALDIAEQSEQVNKKKIALQAKMDRLNGLIHEAESKP